MEKYMESFMKLASLTEPAQSGAEDFFDKMNYAMTPAILLAIAAIVGIEQYVFKPIQCWSSMELDNHRMEYVENYCWIENTFYYEVNKPFSKVEDNKIYYYQWVPFMLMVQAFLFYIPHVLWLMLSNNTGIDIKQIAMQSQKMEQEMDESKRTVTVKFLVESLLKFLRLRERYRQQSLCSCLTSFISGQPACAKYLLSSYLIVKFIYIVNCVGQLLIMQAYFGMKIGTFGLTLLNDIMNNRTWEVTNVFPRVTYCHVYEPQETDVRNRHTIQCVMPLNALNEKFYIFNWFWITIVLCCDVFSVVQSILQFLVGPNRRRLVRQYLKMAERIGVNNFRRQCDCEQKFVDKVLETDGAFVLAIISKNASYLAAVEILAATFQTWQTQANPQEQDALETGDCFEMQERLASLRDF